MARFKSYYTTDEITNDLYTFGKEYMTVDNIEYIGPYHRYVTGEVYTDFKWNPKTSKRLISYVNYENNTQRYRDLTTINISPQHPIQYPCIISKVDIANGFVTRYFINKINENKITEIDKQQYQSWQNYQIDQAMYSAIQLKWTITGTLNDTIQNGITIPGVITKNRKAITASKMPSLVNVLSNLTEFYTDADFIIPKDINNLDS